MELKKNILVRAYVVFIILCVVCGFIVGKAIYIQSAEGKYWVGLADSAHIRFEAIEAERGTIYSEDGQMLSTSVPEFDVYVDFVADGLRDRDGLLFKQNIDSMASGLAGLFKDKTVAEYRNMLKAGYKNKERYFLFKRKISFGEYEAMKQLPLIKLGRNKSGFMTEVRMKRLYPFRLLANRTIGIARDENKVGLEKKYDTSLSGVTGKRLVRYIAGGAGVPIDGTEEDPRDGNDMVTTLDVSMQDAAQLALQTMMIKNEAEHGTCIVLEVKTGKVKAIANLGRLQDGTYWEDYNYALYPTEPGSTWKLVTMLSVLEDKLANLNSVVDLEGGKWNVAGSTVKDSEPHGLHAATVKQAFEHSSNVGMAKLAYYGYYNQPSKFIRHIQALHLDTLTGVDLPGEGWPNIHKPGTRIWSNTTIPWMGFGYNLTVTPMHTAMLYNAVANGGKMMRPYLVNMMLKDGVPVKKFEPVVLSENICTRQTLLQLRECLEGVMLNGTGKKLQTPEYKIAGKTGTALVADKGITYSDHVYQSSFAGYFPADNPQYTIVVVIRNKKNAAKFYGADVAGPVFREVADRIFGGKIQRNITAPQKNDSVLFAYHGTSHTLKNINGTVNIHGIDSSGGKELAELYTTASYRPVVKGNEPLKHAMPLLSGFGLKDALEVCEQRKLRVTIAGKGKVVSQSIEAGTTVKQGQNIHLELN
jgi:cell division protein FtsI (penicillin-binding protein 3)